MNDLAPVNPYLQAVLERLQPEQWQALQPRDPRKEATPVPAYSTEGGREL